MTTRSWWGLLIPTIQQCSAPSIVITDEELAGPITIPAPQFSRQAILSPTDAARTAFEKIRNRSREQAEAIVLPLTDTAKMEHLRQAAVARAAEIVALIASSETPLPPGRQRGPLIPSKMLWEEVGRQWAMRTEDLVPDDL